MRKSEVKFGALLSYILIFTNAFYGMIVSPFLLGKLGESEYGVYKAVAGMTAMVSVMEMGIGGTMQRFIAKMNAEGRRDQSENFSAMGLIQVGMLIPTMVLAGFLLYPRLEATFGAFTPAEILRAKELFGLMIGQMVLHMLENFYFGIIAGYNRFIFSNSLKLTVLVLRILLYFVVLPIFPNSITIVMVGLGLEVFVILVEIIYIRYVLKHRVKLRKWDKVIFRESFAYTVLLFVQSIIIQFNGHVDSIVLAAVMGTSAVTLYSFAIQIFNMYETCATSVSGVLLPTVTKKLVDGADNRDLEKLVVKYGRAQWMFLGAALFGIITCGREFFILWLGDNLGESAADCWGLSLILMIPVTLPLITNTCLTILKARNALGFRTICLACSVVLNFLLTYFGTKVWGYWAAAAGTAASTLCGSIIVMNIYYSKKLKLGMMRIYWGILRGITPALVVASISCLVLNAFLGGTWLAFLLKIAVFLVCYILCLGIFGLNSEERKTIPFLKSKG